MTRYLSAGLLDYYNAIFISPIKHQSYDERTYANERKGTASAGLVKMIHVICILKQTANLSRTNPGAPVISSNECAFVYV